MRHVRMAAVRRGAGRLVVNRRLVQVALAIWTGLLFFQRPGVWVRPGIRTNTAESYSGLCDLAAD